MTGLLKSWFRESWPYKSSSRENWLPNALVVDNPPSIGVPSLFHASRGLE